MTAPASYKENKKEFKFLSLEFLAALGMMFLITSSLDSLLFFNDENAVSQEGDTNPIRQILKLPFYLYTLTFLLKRPNALIPLFRRAWILVVVLLLSVISVIWSIDPDATFRRSIMFLLGTSFAFYLAVRYTPEEFCRLMGLCSLNICILTILAVVLVPSMGIHGGAAHYPALRGFFPHKNSMGPVMVISTLLGIILAFSPKDRKLGRLLFVLSLALGILSLSRTAWLNLIFIMASFGSILFMRRRKALGALLFGSFFVIVISLVCAVGFTDVLSGVTGIVGRSADLTDRTDFWPILIDEVSREHFWLGFGYGAFWDSFNGALSIDWDMQGFIPPHAHNGWLQVFTHLGMTGVVLITLFLFQSSLRNFKVALRDSGVYTVFGIVFLVFFISENITEVFLLSGGHVIWVFFVYWSIVDFKQTSPSALSNAKPLISSFPTR